MRSPAEPASLLYHPLDAVLGSPGAVRVLRVLSSHGGELSTTLIALRARLSRAGAWKVLGHLAELGIVETVGQGRSMSYRLNRQHPLAGVIARLFEAEAERVDQLFARVRDAAERMKPAPQAIWLFGSVARGEDQAGSDLDLAVIGPEREVGRQAEQLEEDLREFTASWSVRPAVITLSLREVEQHARDETEFWTNLLRDAVPLFGAAPSDVSGG